MHPTLSSSTASWHLPTTGRDPKAEYLAEHIPGALFFDIDDLSDEKSSLPHMLPSTVKFASRMKKMGVGDGMRIVVYDTLGLFSAARVWWTFRAMGHEDVAVLNGGLKKWKSEGRPLEDGPPPRRTERHYTPLLNASLVRDMDDMKQTLAKRSAQIVDARPAGRFAGSEPEPRPGLRGGHLPGSRNVPSQLLLNDDGTLKPVAELETIFAGAGIDPHASRDHLVRLRRHRLDPVAGAGRARPDQRRGLRRELGRVGRRQRPADRDRPGRLT